MTEPHTDDFDGTSRIDWRDPRVLAELLGDVDAEIRSIELYVERLKAVATRWRRARELLEFDEDET